MPDIQTGSYHVIQFYPDPTTGEFLNIGIIMLDEQKNNIHVMIPDDINKLNKLSWVGEWERSLCVTSLGGFIERLRDSSSMTMDTYEKYIKYLFRTYTSEACDYIEKWAVHAGGHLQLKEPLSCNVAHVEITLLMLFRTLVNNEA